MKKYLLLVVVFCLTGCSQFSLQGSTFFAEVWDEYVDEFHWSRAAQLSEQEMQDAFLEWAVAFEEKRAFFVHRNTEEVLQGSVIRAGESLSNTLEQYEKALERLQTITAQHQELKTLTRKVCEKQKSSVSCDL